MFWIRIFMGRGSSQLVSFIEVERMTWDKRSIGWPGRRGFFFSLCLHSI